MSRTAIPIEPEPGQSTSFETLARKIGFSRHEVEELRKIYAERVRAESSGTPEADLGQHEEKDR